MMKNFVLILFGLWAACSQPTTSKEFVETSQVKNPSTRKTNSFKNPSATVKTDPNVFMPTSTVSIEATSIEIKEESVPRKSAPKRVCLPLVTTCDENLPCETAVQKQNGEWMLERTGDMVTIEERCNKKGCTDAIIFQVPSGCGGEKKGALDLNCANKC